LKTKIEKDNSKIERAANREMTKKVKVCDKTRSSRHALYAKMNAQEKKMVTAGRNPNARRAS